MARRRRNDDAIRVGDRVVAVQPIGRVPEGATGLVKLVDGLSWVRYWVQWDTGDWIGSLGDDQVVRADRVGAWRARQAEEAERAASVQSASPAGGESGSGAGAEPGDGGAASSVPAHLLERSAAARARRADAAS